MIKAKLNLKGTLIQNGVKNNQDFTDFHHLKY